MTTGYINNSQAIFSMPDLKLILKKLTATQKELISSALLIVIYGLLLNFMFWAFGISDFSIKKIFAFGLLYYFIDAVLLDWIRSLKG